MDTVVVAQFISLSTAINNIFRSLMTM